MTPPSIEERLHRAKELFERAERQALEGNPAATRYRMDDAIHELVRVAYAVEDQRCQ